MSTLFISFNVPEILVYANIVYWPSPEYFKRQNINASSEIEIARFLSIVRLVVSEENRRFVEMQLHASESSANVLYKCVCVWVYQETSTSPI